MSIGAIRSPQPSWEEFLFVLVFSVFWGDLLVALTDAKPALAGVEEVHLWDHGLLLYLGKSATILYLKF